MISEDNVFINCPFDNDYFPLLKSLLFTLIYIELNPKISETTDSGYNRLKKIKDLMLASKYSIHDLSRIEPITKKEYPRFNMPFECGIDFGIKLADTKGSGEKVFLILEKEQYRYQKVISDLAGNDIKSHNNKAELLIKVVRDWYKTIKSSTPSNIEIWTAYNEFNFVYAEIMNKEKLNPEDIASVPFSEIIQLMKNWIPGYKTNLLKS